MNEFFSKKVPKNSPNVVSVGFIGPVLVPCFQTRSHYVNRCWPRSTIPIWVTVTCDQSFPLLNIWPLAVSYVETRSYPSRISQCWSNILRSRGNGAISQEIRDDSSSNKVSFSMIHSLSNTHLPLRGFCFDSIIKRCLMMVILFCRPQPTEVVINRRPVPWLVEKRV